MKYGKLILIVLAVALIAVWGCERKVVNEIVQQNNGLAGAEACMACHNDYDGKLQQAEGEWNNSVHASGSNIDYTNRGGTGNDCTRCHDHQGFLLWVDSGIVAGPYDNVSAIHCFTCHAPHTTGTLALRAEDPVTLIGGGVFNIGKANLCANCHHSRVAPSTITDNFVVTSAYWGPHHGPQGDLLSGNGGYQFAGYSYSPVTPNHSTDLADGCVECHMGSAQSHAGYGIGGHSFNMVDDDGNNLGPLCKNCHATVNTRASDPYDFKKNDSIQYDFDGDGVVNGYQTEFAGLIDTLKEILIDSGIVSASTGLPNVPTGGTLTIADQDQAGALFNYLLLEDDHSEGVHNFRYALALLKSSINYMRTGDPNGVAPHKSESDIYSAH